MTVKPDVMLILGYKSGYLSVCHTIVWLPWAGRGGGGQRGDERGAHTTHNSTNVQLNVVQVHALPRLLSHGALRGELYRLSARQKNEQIFTIFANNVRLIVIP